MMAVRKQTRSIYTMLKECLHMHSLVVYVLPSRRMVSSWLLCVVALGLRKVRCRRLSVRYDPSGSSRNRT